MDVSLFDQGLAQHQQGQYGEAIATFTQLLSQDPMLASAYLQRGLAHYDSGNLHAAISDYNQALELDSKQAKVYYCRALARLALQNLPGTLADAQRAIDCDRTYGLAYQMRGIVRRKQGDISGAIADFKLAAGLFLDQKNPQAARHCLAQIEQIRPQSSPATPSVQGAAAPLKEQDYFNQILDRAKTGQLQQALADINWVLKADPQDGKAYCCRGLIYCKQGHYQGAIADFNQALQLNFSGALTYRSRSLARLQLGDLQGAIADCNQALALNPEESESYVARGNAYRALGHPLGAIEDYAEALTKDGNNGQAFYQRGLTYVALGEIPAAITDYQRAISLWCSEEDWSSYQQVLASLKAIQPQASPKPQTLYDKLRQQLLGLVGGNQDLADGMVKRLKSNYPGRSEEWYLETVLQDLEQNLDPGKEDGLL
ncbi:MAG: tetratricopeptide repeat protein [Acaryochloridaceae cyanobacterium SU_2_1]|nr:tetratricopeptide repeat protein [Acaryochloridaceae cyanobacterium SU_2_1]NJM95619.1 tetratricopeptide repeat protein [Acaryochloridaceae cyanobacterium CSU_5_19]